MQAHVCMREAVILASLCPDTRPPRLQLTRIPARPVSSAGVGRQRPTRAGSAQHRLATARAQAAATFKAAASASPFPTHSFAPLRARLRPPPPSQPHMRLDSCCGRRARPRRRPLGLAACARCGSFAPSLHPWPQCVRTGIEWQRRRGRCAPRTAGQGVCRACLPRARAALAVCRHPCARSIREGRGRRAADAAPALGGHRHGRRPVASSGARRRGGRCPGLPLRTRLRRPPYQHSVVRSRGPVGLSACGRGCARLSLRALLSGCGGSCRAGSRTCPMQQHVCRVHSSFHRSAPQCRHTWSMRPTTCFP